MTKAASRLASVFAGILMLAGCSTGKQSASASSAAAQTSEAAPVPTSANPATIVGTAPRAANDVPSVVVLQSNIPHRYPTQAAKPMMDQIAHTFTPGVLVVRTGRSEERRVGKECRL